MSTAFQLKMNKQGQKHIAGWAGAVQSAWISCCRHDGIPSDAAFAVFSHNNPFVYYLDRAITELKTAQIEYAAGGYVGLSAAPGRPAGQ